LLAEHAVPVTIGRALCELRPSKATTNIWTCARRVDPTWAKELLEDAFAIAPKAQYRTPLDSLQASSADSDESMTMSMQRWEVDSLSLQCRAARAMVDLDRARAVQLFDAIVPVFAAEPMPCERLLQPRVPIYYDTLFDIAKSGFTSAELERGDDIPLVERRLARLRSSVDAGPALVALAKARVDPVRMSRYVAALKTGLEGSAPDAALAAATRTGLTSLTVTLDLLGKACDDAPPEAKRRNISWRDTSPNCRKAPSTCSS
jgi:hypothetical protein